MKFKLLRGTHVQDKKTYSKGNVVSSERNLAKIFPGKFDKLPSAAELLEDEEVINVPGNTGKGAKTGADVEDTDTDADTADDTVKKHRKSGKAAHGK